MATSDKKMSKLEGQVEAFSLKGKKNHGKNEKDKLTDLEH